MKNQFAACIVSAVIGAALAIWWHDRPQPILGPATVTAQDRSDRRLDRIDDTGPASRPPRPIDADLDAGILPAEFSPEEKINISVYERVNRSVVNITTKSWSPEMFLMREPPSDGAGSGSVYDKEGHILTNDHVIAGASQVHVTLHNGESFRARLVGRDPSNDTAVLRIDAPREMLFPISVGESSALKVGQKVFALGNPFGLERTMTAGILSSVSRTLATRSGREMSSILQIDAALNPGNSGGPLLSTRGVLIGMNTAIASPSGAGENTGVGFAIPANILQRVVPQLIEFGRVIRPTIGIVQVLERDRGLLIANVAAGGPADEAGLQGFRIVRESRRGLGIVTYLDRSHADLLVAIDGQPVNSAEGLLDIVESKQPGDRVLVTVIRDRRELVVPVILDEDD